MSSKMDASSNTQSPQIKKKRWSTFGVVTVTLLVGGCALCCSPYDYDYPASGGIIHRSNPQYGRVGSIFSDPGPFGGASADSNLQTKTLPEGGNNDNPAGSDSRNNSDSEDELPPPIQRPDNDIPLPPAAQPNSDDFLPPPNTNDSLPPRSNGSF